MIKALLFLLVSLVSFPLFAELPAALRNALERVEAGAGGAAEERVLRRFVSDASEEVQIAARVGMSRSLRGRGQECPGSAWARNR